MQHDRYSRSVRLLKVVLPTLAVTLILAVFLFPRTLLIDSISLSGMSFNPSEGLRLLAPHFTGTTDAGDPFDVRADWALPDAPDPTSIDLGPLEGNIRLRGNEILRLTAAAGNYRPKDETMSLRGGVTLDSGSGYRLSVADADIDLAGETLRAEGPVEGTGDSGRISAGSMRVERHGGNNYIWFEGGVRVIVTSPGPSSP